MSSPVYLWGQPGCIAAQTKLSYVSRGPDGKTRSTKGGSIERLYQVFHGLTGPGKGRYQVAPVDSQFWVSSVDDEGRIFKNRVLDVVQSGQRKCLRLRTKSGLEIEATDDHEFMSDGEFAALRDLRPGSVVDVHTNKIINTSTRRPKRSRASLSVPHHPYASTHVIEKKYTYKALPLARAIVEADMNSLSIAEYQARLNSGDLRGLQFLKKSDDVHHRDEDCTNDVIENLEVISHTEHARRHGLRYQSLRYVTTRDEVDWIQPVGVKETYDLKMAGPYHNFVAASFVVHNCGKSDIVKRVAKELELPVIDIRAVLLDPVDLRGIPYVRDGVAHWASPSFLPRDGEGIMFLDEIANAPPMVQSALLQLILDGKVGEYTKPPGWRFVAASNRVGDRAGSHKIISSLANRFACHINMEVDHEDWNTWAIEAGIAPDIRSFLNFKPALLSQFNPNSDEPAFSTPRSWKFASDLIANIPEGMHLQVLSGTVGAGCAAEYVAFRDVYMRIPTLEQIVKDPQKVSVNNDPATNFALVGALTDACGRRPKNKEVLNAVVEFICRLPAAFATVFFRDVSLVAPITMNLPGSREWVRKHRGTIA